MKKQKLYNVTYLKNNTKVETIKLTESLMWELLEEYTGKKLDVENCKDQDIIIKVFLPSNKDEEVSSRAMTILQDGIIHNENEYIPFETSPSMMKEEGLFRKCEFLFIKKEHEGFKEIYRDIISAGMINKLYNKDKVCINKDISARVSLSLSGSNRVNKLPRILVLESAKFKHKAKYSTFVHSKLIDSEIEKKFEFADGCGFVSPSFLDEIQKELKVDHRIDFIGLRMFPMAMKGLAIRCDFMKYFEENYNEDTDYFKKQGDTFLVKDYFGNMVDLSKIDMIVNTNMAKWGKLYEDEKFDDINTFIQEKLDKKYKDILNSIYITKINKEAIKEYSQLNYQVFNNVALTVEELRELQEPSKNYLKEILALEDVNKIKIFMGDIAWDDEDEELRTYAKAHRLLQIDDRFISNGKVKSEVLEGIYSKAHEIICKPWVKGNYKTVAICPITYLNWIMTRKIEPHLKEGEFYVPNEEGKRVVARNPLAVFSEVHKIELVKNEKLDKYFGELTSEIMFCNQADNLAFISSGMDYDLDTIGVWDNDILYNAVIEPKGGYNFNYADDGSKVECKWSEEEEFKAILKASGNLIGSLANIANKISTECNEIGYLYNDIWCSEDFLLNMYLKQHQDLKNKLDKALNDLKAIKDIIKDNNYSNYAYQYGIEISEEDYLKKEREKYYKVKSEVEVKFKAKLMQLVEEGEVIDLSTQSTEIQRKWLIKRFHENREKAYYALQLNQKAIDAPKTLALPNKADIEKLKSYTSLERHPRFMYYHKFTTNKDSIEVGWYDTEQTNCALDITSQEIYEELIEPIKIKLGKKEVNGRKKKPNDNPYRIWNLLKEIAGEENAKCVEEIAKTKKYHSQVDKKAKTIKDKEAKKEFWALERLKMIENIGALRQFYTDGEIAQAIVKNECNSTFMFNYCWDIIEVAIASKEREVYIYRESEDGEIDWMFKKYMKKPAKLVDGKLQEAYIEQLERQANYTNFNVGGLTGAGVGINDMINITSREYVNKKGEIIISYDVYVNGEKLGFIYPNSIKSELKDSYTVKNASLEGKYIKMKVA
ncbi:RNA dependent RNA polymerase [Clostridium disporicum]|nr:RNA dependent RNA polymerase [Clostridium disporicum]